MSDTTLLCPICSSAHLADKPFGYRFNGRWLGAKSCLECGIIFLHPQPTAEEIARMYSREYFEGDFRCGHAGNYFDETTLNSLADRGLIAHIKRFKPSGDFLEIGCAGGAFLNAAREAGFRVNGVEYSDDAAAFARSRFGLNVVTGDLTHAAYQDGAFDVVFMGDVLEHLAHPVATVNEVHRVLRPGGLFVIECPMQTNTLFSRAGFLAYALLGKKATVNLPPYHLFEYRPNSMKHLLRQCGFEVTLSREVLISPKDVTLRGTRMQRIGKKLFQYPNSWVTGVTGKFGDRIEVFATRKA